MSVDELMLPWLPMHGRDALRVVIFHPIAIVMEDISVCIEMLGSPCTL